MLGAGAFTGYMTVLFASFALVWLLDEVMHLALAFFLVAALYGIAAAVLLSRGRQEIKQVDPVPRQTVETLMLFWRGADGWEPTTIRTFLRLLSPGSTVLDVGANSGLFSLLAARRHPTVSVHAVEPVALVFSVLESNVALNRLDNVTCHRFACRDRPGPARLHVPTAEAVPVMASLMSGWSGTVDTDEPVECVTVDGLVATAGVERVDVVKIDAEGSEDAVLRGARITLGEHRPFVVAEVLGRSGLAESVTAAMGGHDYRFFRLGRGGVHPCAAISGGTDDDENHNYLFAHRSRLEELHSRLEGRISTY